MRPSAHKFFFGTLLASGVSSFIISFRLFRFSLPSQIRLLTTPPFDIDDPPFVRTTGAIILMIAYGYPVKDHGDPFVGVVEAAVKGFSESLEPGAYLVDVIPARELPFFRLCNVIDA